MQLRHPGAYALQRMNVNPQVIEVFFFEILLNLIDLVYEPTNTEWLSTILSS